MVHGPPRLPFDLDLMSPSHPQSTSGRSTVEWPRKAASELCILMATHPPTTLVLSALFGPLNGFKRHLAQDGQRSSLIGPHWVVRV
jgi:hypothetical protein